MKWLPEPSEPSCSGQCGAPRRRPARRRAAPRSSSTRGSAVSPHLLVVAAGRQRTARAICSCRTRGPAGEVGGGELGADGHHPAADVHADRGRDDRAVGRDDRADGRALAQVGVGHQRQVRADERHGRGAQRLLAGAVLEDGRPVQQAVVDLLHGPFRRGWVGCCAAGASTRRRYLPATPLRSSACHGPAPGSCSTAGARRRPAGAGRAHGWPVLGPEGRRGLVDPEGRARPGRRPAGRRPARVRGGAGLPGAGDRAGAAGLRPPVGRQGAHRLGR